MIYDALLSVRLFQWSVPEPNSGCWLWIGRRDRKNYGRISIHNITCLAHRASFATFRGRIPMGLSVLHRCDCPPCINPDHLFLGTKADNSADMARKGRAARGEKNGGGTKLSPDSVRELRALYKAGMRVRELMPIFGVGKPTAYNVINRETWAWVDERP